MGSVRNANIKLNINNGNIFLGLFLRLLLLSSLVGTSEISAQGYKNTLSIRNRNDVNPLSHENEIVDYLIHDSLMMGYPRDKRGNNCGEIEIEREKINKQKKVTRKHARENARNIRRNARKEIRGTVRNYQRISSGNPVALEGVSTLVGTGGGTNTGAIAGGLAVAGGIGGAIAGGVLSVSKNTKVNKETITENEVYDKENTSSGNGIKEKDKSTVNNVPYFKDNAANNYNINPIQAMDVNQPAVNNIPAPYVDVSHIPRLNRFMPPMKYFDFLYNGEKLDVIHEIQDAIKLHYNNAEDIHLHYFNERINTIPEEYVFLREIVPQLKSQVEAAKNYVRSALYRFTRSITVTHDVDDPYKIILQHKTANGYVVDYFKSILDTQNPHIVDEALVRFYNALINMRNYFNDKIGRVIFASAIRNGLPYVHNELAPMGFVMANDQEQRVIIMADQFSPQYLKTTKPQITVLHEVSHHAVATRDFVLSPTTKVVGDALDFIEAMEEALIDEIHINGERTIINFDMLFMQAYGNVVGDIPVTVPQIKEMAKLDPMLRANIMMDNADFLARMIFDIGQGISYDSGVSSRTKRNSQSGQEIQRIVLIKTLLFLSNRINGDYQN